MLEPVAVGLLAVAELAVAVVAGRRHSAVVPLAVEPFVAVLAVEPLAVPPPVAGLRLAVAGLAVVAGRRGLLAVGRGLADSDLTDLAPAVAVAVPALAPAPVPAVASAVLAVVAGRRLGLAVVPVAVGRLSAVAVSAGQLGLGLPAVPGLHSGSAVAEHLPP